MRSLRLLATALLVAVGLAFVASAASARGFPDYFADCPWWNANCRVMPLTSKEPVIPEPAAALLFAGGAIWVARRARAAR